MSDIKKLVNDPLKVADELLDGLVEAYDGDCEKVGRRSIVKTSIPAGKVGPPCRWWQRARTNLSWAGREESRGRCSLR